MRQKHGVTSGPEFIAWRKRHKLTRAKAAETLSVSIETIDAWSYDKRGVPSLVARVMILCDEHPRLVLALLEQAELGR